MKVMSHVWPFPVRVVNGMEAIITPKIHKKREWSKQLARNLFGPFPLGLHELDVPISGIKLFIVAS
jgi:hypothetical protein